MTKQESQMRRGAEAIKVIVSFLPDPFDAHPDSENIHELGAEILERYLNLIRYVSAHSTRQSGYTISELRGMVHDYGFEFESEITDVIDHYCFEVTALYIPNQEGA